MMNGSDRSRRVKKNVSLGVAALVVIWTIVVHAQSHWNPILAYPLWAGIAAHSFVVDNHHTLTWDKIGFATELAVNLATYLALTIVITARFLA